MSSLQDLTRRAAQANVPRNCDTRTTILPNGVRVLTEEVPGGSSAAISILIEASPQDEVENNRGVAHLTEHALFLGTPQRCNRELAQLIDSAGGCFGAFTAPDYTCFYAHALEDYTSYAIDLLGDILTSSEVPEELLQRETKVVRQEIRGAQDNHSDMLLQENKKLLWGDDALSRSITGSEEELGRLTRDNVLSFVRDHYGADRIIVAAAGALNHRDLVDQIQDAFWPLEKAAQRHVARELKALGGIKIIERPTTQATFSVALPTAPYADQDRYVLHLINNLLGGGMSSRLYQALREEEGLVYSVRSELLSYQRGGMLLVEGVTTVENIFPCILRTLYEIEQLATSQVIDEEELWVSQMRVRSQSLLSTDMISNRVARMASQEFHFGARIPDEQIVASIDSVSIQDLQRVGRQALLPALANLCISVLGPLSPDASELSSLTDLHQYYQGLGIEAISEAKFC